MLVPINTPANQATRYDDGRTGAAAQPARGWRVLVVDDNADLAEITAMLLRRAGYEVLTAYDGPTALEAAAFRSPDVVLLDIGMPGMDGYEVARRLRRLPHLKDARLVALTAHDGECDDQLAREAGIDFHLLKPADRDELMTLVAPRESRWQA
jgi:two-component system CheB/CheR fusion protein